MNVLGSQLLRALNFPQQASPFSLSPALSCHTTSTMPPLNPAAPTFQPKTKSSPISVPSSPGPADDSLGLPDDPWALSNMTEVNGGPRRPAGGATSLTLGPAPCGLSGAGRRLLWGPLVCLEAGAVPELPGRLLFGPNPSRALTCSARSGAHSKPPMGLWAVCTPLGQCTVAGRGYG